MILSSK
jgi:ribosome biogenesis protein ENP2